MLLFFLINILPIVIDNFEILEATIGSDPPVFGNVLPLPPFDTLLLLDDAFLVINDIAPASDSFPAASIALMLNSYLVPGLRSPISTDVLSLTVANNLSPLYTLYATTPTLSVDASQLILTLFFVTFPTLILFGIVGASVSASFLISSLS